MKTIHKLTASIFLVSLGAIAITQTNLFDNSEDSLKKTLPNDNDKMDEKTITIVNGIEPKSMDPHKVSDLSSNKVVRQMFEGLTTFDKNGGIVAGMATHWQTTDNKTWTFYLRNAKWSNGEPVTADDFVYSFRRAVNPATASPYSSYFADANIINAQAIIDGELPIDKLGVKALDSQTLQINLDKPTPYLADMMVNSVASPIYPPVVEEYGDKWTEPSNIVVNGAYTLDTWKSYDYIKLKRNPAYYANQDTKINTAIFLPIESGGEKLYDENRIDFFESANFLNSHAPISEKKITPMLCTYYYEFNMQKPPFNDVRVRKALAYATNREVITDKILLGHVPAYQFTPPTINTNTEQPLQVLPTWQALTMQERIAKAKDLLKQAGYNQDNPLQFELIYNTPEEHKKIAQALKSMWQNNLKDVKVKLVNKEWKNYLDIRKNGDYQVARSGWCGDYNEPSTFLNLLKSNNSLNYSGYHSKAYDNIMEKTLAPNTSDQQRLELYRQAEMQLDQDMPMINLYHYSNFMLIKPYVKGYPFNNPMSEWKIKDMSIERENH